MQEKIIIVFKNVITSLAMPSVVSYCTQKGDAKDTVVIAKAIKRQIPVNQSWNC